MTDAPERRVPGRSGAGQPAPDEPEPVPAGQADPGGDGAQHGPGVSGQRVRDGPGGQGMPDGQAGAAAGRAAAAALLLGNDPEVLGPWVNAPWLNMLASVIVSVLVMLSGTLVASTLFTHINRWRRRRGYPAS